MKDNWTQRQKNIYDGLSSIGKEIAGFYEAGLKLYYDNFPNGSNFLMHAAREIDGGLRDILAVDFDPEKDEEEKLKKSILFSLGITQFECFSGEWYSVSKKLHKFAHRQGAWKSPRDMSEVREIWIDYEGVLEKLVGSYYPIIERIEHIGKLKTLEGGPFEVLCNILSIPFYSKYFFRKENNINWVPLLKKKLYFAPVNLEFDKQGNALFWDVLFYLEKVSQRISDNPQYGNELIGIVNDLVQFSLNKKHINSYHIWWYCVKILNNLPTVVIKATLKVENFKVWLSVWTDSSLGGDLAISDIGKDLLPKFLQDDFGSDYSYAEAIVDAITAIKIGTKPYSFSRREDIVLNWGKYWVLDAFKRNAALIGQKCFRNLIFRIADKLKVVLEYEHQDYGIDLNIDEDVYRVHVSRVPKDSAEIKGISFKDTEYKFTVGKFSSEELKDKDSEKNPWVSRNLEPKDKTIEFSLSVLTEDSFIPEVKKKLPEGIIWESAADFKTKFTIMYKWFQVDYSQIWCRSLAGGEKRDTYSSTKEILTVILRDIILAKCEKNSADGLEVLKEFLTDKYRFPIFKRFVLLCLDKYWEKYPGLLEEFFNVVPKPLEGSDLEVELQSLLKDHNLSFSPEFNEKLLTLIKQPPEFPFEEKDRREIAPYWWKFRWLSPLRENPLFSSLYEETKQKVQPKDGKPYEPERSSTFKGGIVVHKSPIAKEDLLSKTIPEIIEFLSGFKGADFFHGAFQGEPDKEGLATVLQEAVKENPKKFTDELPKFKSVGNYYLCHIIRGLEAAWNTEKPLEWGIILNFIFDYFNRNKDTIIKEATEGQEGNTNKGRYLRIVEAIVELISDGSKDDARAFAPDYFDKVEQIFDSIIPLLKGEEHPSIDSAGAVTYALNTALGRVVMAYVTFSLRVARIKKEKKKDWGKEKFEIFLSKGADGFVWFGFYLPQMKYLDKEYTEGKIKDFAQKDPSDFGWQMFMEGYLTGSQIYADLYELMRSNYKKTIQSTVFKGRVDDRLVEHICVGYLYLNESLTDTKSLFWKLLNESDKPETRGRWKDVARFFWRKSKQWEKEEKSEESEEKLIDIQKKIMDFWSWTVKEQNFVKSKLGEDYNSFLSQMAFLAVWLDKIDDSSEKLLMQSVPYVDIEHSASFFIEYLTKFEDSDSIKRIGKILKKVLEISTPMFEDEKITLLVERLYELGKTDPQVKTDANEICNTYGRRGAHFLRETFFKNNK